MIRQKKNKHHGGSYSQFGGKRKGVGHRLLSRVDDMRRDLLCGANIVKTKTLEVARDIADLFGDLSKLHGKLWNHRIGRIQAPNFTSHANSIVTLVLACMQIFLLLGFIKATDGHIGNVRNISTVMIPAYFAFGLNLLLQISALYFVINRAVNEEKKSDLHPRHTELNRFLPVFEHLVVVVSYILFLLTAYAIGSCHLIFSPEKEPTGICQSFNLKAVQVIMGLVIAVKLLHHIVSIYNHYHHTSTPSTYPQTISSIESEAMVDAEAEEGDGVMDKLSSVDQSVMEGWQFWKFRMNRILSANVADNMCKIWGITFLGGFIIHLVTKVHNNHGNMGNISDMPTQLWPLYTMFFGKAVVQCAVLLYVYCNHFPYERTLGFIHHFKDQPSQGWKVVEHCIPMLTNIFFGILTMAIGQCHLNPLLNKGQTMCQIFSYKIVMGAIVVVALIQFLHHILAMWHFHKHCDTPEAHKGSDDEMEMTINRSKRNGT